MFPQHHAATRQVPRTSANRWRRVFRRTCPTVDPLTQTRYPAPMTTIPTPYVDTEAPQSDSEELAQLYEARAAKMEQEAADARSPQQQEGLRLAAGSFRRKAAAVRARLEGKA